MRALLIPVEGPPKVVEQNGLDDLQKLVGGWIEGLNCVLPESYAFGYENAKFENRYLEDENKWVEGLPLNPLGSALVYGEAPRFSRKRMGEEMKKAENDGFFVIDAGTGDPREPFVAGPIVVTGTSRGGETMPITDMAIQIVNSVVATLKTGEVEDTAAGNEVRDFAQVVGAYEELR